MCLPPPLLFLHAANGETARTAAVALGAHVGTVEVQVRPVHARRRVRRTAPGVTVRAHTVQAAGTAGAVTRSGVEVGSARFVGAIVIYRYAGKSEKTLFRSPPSRVEIFSGSQIGGKGAKNTHVVPLFV